MLSASQERPGSCHTIFEYLYCDASNFKARGSLLLSGSLAANERNRIASKMECGEFFIAEQVGADPLYESLYAYSNGPTAEDHVWHTFVGFRDVADDDSVSDMTCWGSSKEFLKRFDEVAEWNLLLSPHSRLAY